MSLFSGSQQLAPEGDVHHRANLPFAKPSEEVVAFGEAAGGVVLHSSWREVTEREHRLATKPAKEGEPLGLEHGAATHGHDVAPGEGRPEPERAGHAQAPELDHVVQHLQGLVTAVGQRGGERGPAGLGGHHLGLHAVAPVADGEQEGWPHEGVGGGGDEADVGAVYTEAGGDSGDPAKGVEEDPVRRARAPI